MKSRRRLRPPRTGRSSRPSDRLRYPRSASVMNWVRNAIDRFILAALERDGIAPSPEADRATLIRRASLDLIGLPATPAEVESFLSDGRPDAYERLVDRLLASPHYGERWARPWLDLARYADSNGYSIDAPRSIWPYRDWVIDALNRDLPFDAFATEQLAGDLLPGATLAQRVATGFHRNTPINQEGGIDREQFRVESILDRTNTTGTVFLGLTIGCCQCHDHKYDPVTQEEYYKLFAFFNNCDEPEIPVASPEEVASRDEAEAKIAAYLEGLWDREPPLRERQRAWEQGARHGAAGRSSRRRSGPPSTSRSRSWNPAKNRVRLLRPSSTRPGGVGGAPQRRSTRSGRRAPEGRHVDGRPRAHGTARDAPPDARRLHPPRRDGRPGRAGRPAAAESTIQGDGRGPADGPGALARRPGQPVDGAGDGQPPLAGLFRPRPGRDRERLRRARGAAEPPGAARLARHRVHRPGLEPQGNAPADGHVGRVPPVVARPARTSAAGRSPDNQPAGRGRPGCGSKPRSSATRR